MCVIASNGISEVIEPQIKSNITVPQKAGCF